jgi:hypothetical protein
VSRPAPQPLAPADRVVRNPGVLSAEIDGEVVALDVARGACYGLDTIGARIWSLIDSPIAIGDICEALTGEYDVDATTCRADVLDLFTALHGEGLIDIAPGSPSSPEAR